MSLLIVTKTNGAIHPLPMYVYFVKTAVFRNILFWGGSVCWDIFISIQHQRNGYHNDEILSSVSIKRSPVVFLWYTVVKWSEYYLSKFFFCFTPLSSCLVCEKEFSKCTYAYYTTLDYI